MIQILGDIPYEIAVATSGGADSMAALDFLRRTRKVIALHYNHGTPSANKAEDLVKQYCIAHEIPLYIGVNNQQPPSGVSMEAWWREKRYDFFERTTDLPVVTAHHLDDAVENWIFTSMHGHPFLIPNARDRYIRPFLLTRKADFVDWCDRKYVPFVEDPSNNDTKYRRNYIRHTLMPHALEINPGIHKTIKKKIIDKQHSI